jgi:hypothetical protein
MQTVGFAMGAAAAGGAAAPALGDGHDPEGALKNLVWNPIGSGNTIFDFAFGGLADSLKSIVPGSPDTVGEVAFHQAAVSSYSQWEHTRTIADNWTSRIGSIASIEARKAIADSYEAGESKSSARQAAADVIFEIADTAYQNSYVSKQANLLQLSYIVDAALQTDQVPTYWESGFFAVADADYTGSGSLQGNQTRIKSETVDQTITLPSGETTELVSVQYEIAWDNGDSWSSGVDNNLIDSYDSSSGEFTVTTDNGNQFTNDFSPTVPSVPDKDLTGKTVADLGSLVETLNQIESTVTTLQNNYDLTFVEDLYAALDSGSITPNQLRGVEALASLLSGSTSVTESRYQLALSTLLDVPRPDLSDTSIIEAEISGWSDVQISVDLSDTRHFTLSDYLDSVPSQGQIFAEVITSDLKSGEKYLVDPLTITGANIDTDGEGDVSQLSASLKSMATGRKFASYQMDNSGGPSATIHDYEIIGDTIYFVGGDNAAQSDSQHNAFLNSFSLESGSLINKYTDQDGDDNISTGTWSPTQIVAGPDGTLITDDIQGKVFLRDVSDFSVIASAYGPAGTSSYIPPDKTAFYDASSGLFVQPEIAELDSTDTQTNAFSVSESSITLSWSVPEFGDVYQTVESVVIDDGSNDYTVVSKSGPSDSKTTVARAGTILGRIGETTFRAYDSSTDKINDIDVSTGEISNSADWGAGSTPERVTAGGSIVCSDGSLRDPTGTELFQLSSPGQRVIRRDRTAPGDFPGLFDGLVLSGTWAGTNGTTDKDTFHNYPLYSGEIQIIGMQDSDGNSVDQAPTDIGDDETNWGPPPTETTNNEEFAEYLDKISDEFAESLEEVGEPDNINVGSGVDNAGDLLNRIVEGAATALGVSRQVIVYGIAALIGIAGLNALSG